MTFLAITWQGYTFLSVLILSFYTAYRYLRKEKGSSLSGIGCVGIIIFSIAILPVMFSLSFWQMGTNARIGILAFWIIGISLVYLFQKKAYAKLRNMILKYLIYVFLALIILGFDIALIYFLYQVLITGEKSDAPVWAVLVCFMFVAALTIAIVRSVINYFRNATSATQQRSRPRPRCLQ